MGDSCAKEVLEGEVKLHDTRNGRIKRLCAY